MAFLSIDQFRNRNNRRRELVRLQASKSSLPTYTREEVAKHNSPANRVWVTYQDGVYDVTEFVEMHPGGASRLLMAAGGALDPFWNMYKQHQTQEVKSLLEEYRIGTLVSC